MSETLAPCPFCGGNAELQWYAHPNVTRFYWVACTQCQADTPLQGIDTSNQEAVIEFWNRRAESADHAALVARIAELERNVAEADRIFATAFRQERSAKDKRIAELEAQLAAARRWEPLPQEILEIIQVWRNAYALKSVGMRRTQPLNAEQYWEQVQVVDRWLDVCRVAGEGEGGNAPGTA